MSANRSWKQFTVARLARDLGALGEIIVDDVMFDLGLEDGELQPRQMMGFLARLQRELPESVDRDAILRDLASTLLSNSHE